MPTGAAGYLQRLFELEARLAWPAERLAAERLRALRALLAHAKRRSSFYARRLAHLDPSSLSEADLGSIPPLSKGELMQHWNDIVSVPRLTLARCEAHMRDVGEGNLRLGEHRIFASGGSSSLRAVTAYSEEEWLLLGLAVRRWMLRAVLEEGLSLPERPVVAQIHAGAPTHISGMLGAGAAGAVMHALPVTLPLSAIVERLNRLQPDSLSAYASVLRMLAEEAIAGRLRIRPRSLLSAGEPLCEEDAEQIRKAWNTFPFDAYGSTEVGILAVGDGSTPGLYLNDDLAIVEPVDGEGRPVAPGQRSAKLYVTPLHHRSVPVLRYELTDEVTLLAEPCPRGSSFRRIARVEGRLDDVFCYPGGVRVHPSVFRSPLTRCSAITAYQVRQSKRGAEIAVVSGRAFDSEGLAREIARGLAGVGVIEPEVRVQRVAGIQRTQNGAKLRRFVPLS